MTWYKAGSVTVNNGETSVIGIGTKFVTNSRVGDGFRGPDGQWYEITNQGSETSIGIYPSYQGPSVVSNTNYMIAPIQGYNKESADRLRAITDGVAAVSSVNGKSGQVVLGKVDIGLANVDNTSDINKPVSDAVALELAKRTPTTSKIDMTSDRLVKVGDYGENGGNPIIMTRGDNANDFTVSGTYLFNDGGVNLPIQYCYLKHYQHTSNYSKQIAYALLGDQTYDRVQVNGVWTPWIQTVKAGANSTITSLTGLTTPLSIAQGGTGNTTGTATKLAASAIVGTVSQSGGVPTGAIIERGSNVNGSFVKWADGTLEVTNTRTIYASVYNITTAPIYRSDVWAGSDFAFPFVSQPVVSVTVTAPSGDLAWLVSQGAVSNTKFPSLYLLSYYNPTNVTWRINEVAKGRWY